MKITTEIGKRKNFDSLHSIDYLSRQLIGPLWDPYISVVGAALLFMLCTVAVGAASHSDRTCDVRARSSTATSFSVSHRNYW